MDFVFYIEKGKSYVIDPTFTQA